jgi:hypothetical protein
MSFCPACFRNVKKSPLSLLCPECELKATVSKEAETTRRLMRDQEKDSKNGIHEGPGRLLDKN